MTEFKVYATESFYSDYNRLDKSLRDRLDKIKEQLKTNPYSGKPLGYDFFREKKLDGFRLYYLVFEKYLVVLVIAFSDKKTQQKTIDYIKRSMDIYRKDIENMFK